MKQITAPEALHDAERGEPRDEYLPWYPTYRRRKTSQMIGLHGNNDDYGGLNMWAFM